MQRGAPSSREWVAYLWSIGWGRTWQAKHLSGLPHKEGRLSFLLANVCGQDLRGAATDKLLMAACVWCLLQATVTPPGLCDSKLAAKLCTVSLSPPLGNSFRNSWTKGRHSWGQLNRGAYSNLRILITNLKQCRWSVPGGDLEIWWYII